MLKLFLEAYKQAKIEQQRQKNLKRFLRLGGLDYIAIQDMVNQALAGVIFNITLPDTTRIEVRREDPYERLQRTHDKELY